MAAVQQLDTVVVRRWAELSLQALAEAREVIDALNVYPVPDGDTGTNLYLTVESAVQELEALEPSADLRTTAAALAHGSLMGARGSSGIILSQLVRGITVPAPAAGRTGLGGAELADALRRAAEMGYAAVARPVEGTMLTVARAAADGAQRVAGASTEASRRLAEVVRGAAAAAREALDRTPQQLDALRVAGVVDAGGAGLVVVLDALVEAVTGEHRTSRSLRSWVRDRGPATAALTAHEVPARPGPVPAPAPAGGPAYEVMYLLDAPEPAVPALSAALDRVGDCVVVVGGDGLWNVHVHVGEVGAVGAAIEAGIAAGRPHRIRVTPLAEVAPTGRGVVTVVAGEGLAELSERSGAVVVAGGPGRRASTAELLAGIERTGAREVVVLPNDRDSHAVAEAAARVARQRGLQVAVVPTHATVQSLAALAVHDPRRRFEDDVVSMTAAASSTRHGAVTVATTEAVTAAGCCRPGDVLGVVDGEFVVVGGDLEATALAVVDRLLGGSVELVTVVVGAGAPPSLAPAVVAHVERVRPDVTATVYDGGQSRYPLLLGAE